MILQSKEYKCTPYTQEYNLIPKSEDKQYICIGGDGGKEFSTQFWSTTVKNFKAFWVKNRIVKIVLLFYDGNEVTWGNDEKDMKNAEIELEKGETLKGNMEVCQQTLKDKKAAETQFISCLRFTTSADKTFEAGEKDNSKSATVEKDTFPVDGSFLGGFFGAFDSKLTRIGVILWKPIILTKIIDIYFDNLNLFSGAQINQTNRWATLCNDTDKEEHQSYVLDKNYGYKRSIRVDQPQIPETDIEMETSQPIVTKMNMIQVWGPSPLVAGKSHDFKYGKTQSSVPLNVKPKSIVYGSFTWAEGFIKNQRLPLNMLIQFEDGSNVVFNLQGKMDLTTATEITISVNEHMLEEQEKCIK